MENNNEYAKFLTWLSTEYPNNELTKKQLTYCKANLNGVSMQSLGAEKYGFEMTPPLSLINKYRAQKRQKLKIS